MKKLLSVVLSVLLLAGFALPAVASDAPAPTHPPLPLDETVWTDTTLVYSLHLPTQTRLRIVWSGAGTITFNDIHRPSVFPSVLLCEERFVATITLPAGEYHVSMATTNVLAVIVSVAHVYQFRPFPSLPMDTSIVATQGWWYALTASRRTSLHFTWTGDATGRVFFQNLNTSATFVAELCEEHSSAILTLPAGEYEVLINPHNTTVENALTVTITVEYVYRTWLDRVMDFGWGLSAWVIRTFPSWLAAALHVIAIPFQVVILMIAVPLSMFVEWIRR